MRVFVLLTDSCYWSNLYHLIGKNKSIVKPSPPLWSLQAAQEVQKLSTVLFQCLYFKERDPQTDPNCVANAVIYAIKNNGLLVFVPESVSQLQPCLRFSSILLNRKIGYRKLMVSFPPVLPLSQVRRQRAGVPEEPWRPGGGSRAGRQLQVAERLRATAAGQHHHHLWQWLLNL